MELNPEYALTEVLQTVRNYSILVPASLELRLREVQLTREEPEIQAEKLLVDGFPTQKGRGT